MIGISKATKRIISISSVKRGQLLGSVQDGCREFISLLACICADGKTDSVLPPALIYQAETGDL